MMAARVAPTSRWRSVTRLYVPRNTAVAVWMLWLTNSLSASWFCADAPTGIFALMAASAAMRAVSSASMSSAFCLSAALARVSSASILPCKVWSACSRACVSSPRETIVAFLPSSVFNSDSVGRLPSFVFSPSVKFSSESPLPSTLSTLSFCKPSMACAFGMT